MHARAVRGVGRAARRGGPYQHRAPPANTSC